MIAWHVVYSHENLNRKILCIQDVTSFKLLDIEVHYLYPPRCISRIPVNIIKNRVILLNTTQKYRKPRWLPNMAAQ